MNSQPENLRRYQRQEILPQIGPQGQMRLGQARVLLIGIGALGATMAELLARAGVGRMRLVDRDLVELNNLQRQVLFDQGDATLELPKAVAAMRRLTAINSTLRLEPVVADVNATNIEALSRFDGKAADLILDGTDNAATRYLINDLAVRDGIPWIYGACVGVSGRVMGIWPGKTGCFRCVYPEPPDGREMETCDTAGVLGPAAGATAAIQAATALRFLVGGPPDGGGAGLLALNVWEGEYRVLNSAAHPQADCPCCGKREFPFLSTVGEDFTTTLCGRSAVQVQSAGRKMEIQLARAAERLRPAGLVRTNAYFLRCRLNDPAGIELTLFPDGRLLVHGTDDPLRAKSIYARFIGT
ncbi:MAG: ThiF family adenylyltransferase [Tepidisphaeraceae bacterium]